MFMFHRSFLYRTYVNLCVEVHQEAKVAVERLKNFHSLHLSSTYEIDE